MEWMARIHLASNMKLAKFGYFFLLLDLLPPRPSAPPQPLDSWSALVTPYCFCLLQAPKRNNFITPILVTYWAIIFENYLQFSKEVRVRQNVHGRILLSSVAGASKACQTSFGSRFDDKLCKMGEDSVLSSGISITLCFLYLGSCFYLSSGLMAILC